LERIHDLRALLEEAAMHESRLKKFRRLCAEVTAYYIQERHFFLGAKPGREEVEANLERARGFVELIEELAGNM